MADHRLKNTGWRRRVGFDNIATSADLRAERAVKLLGESERAWLEAIRLN